MKQIFINEDSLKEEDIDFEVIRVKALIINSNREILLVHNNGTYQFPGGHKEDWESLEDCLVREITEETGIEPCLDRGPFMRIMTYDGNYFGTGKKVCNKIYYYVVYSDQEPDFSKTHYDELECQTEFNLFYVELENIKDFLEDSTVDGSLDEKIGREMMMVIDEYNRVYDGGNLE